MGKEEEKYLESGKGNLLICEEDEASLLGLHVH
jgi:hypothetical protein